MAPPLAYPQSAELKDKTYAVALDDWQRSAGQMRATRAGTHPEWARALFATWEEEEKKPNKGRVIELVTNPKDAREMGAALEWLRARVLLDQSDARYSFAYAFNLFRTRDQGGDYRTEAIHFFLHGKIAIRIDGARCANASAPANKILGLESQLKELEAFTQTMPPRAFWIARLMAVALEDFVGPRERQEWLCSGGLTAVQDFRDLQEVPTPPGGIGRTFVIDGSKAEFIEDAEWRKRRDEYLSGSRKQALTLPTPAAR